VTAGLVTEASAQLSVGVQSQTIEVTSGIDNVQVNTESQTLSETITSKEIEILPTSPTRNPTPWLASPATSQKIP